MLSTALPIGHQFVLILAGPPIMAILWWLRVHGLGNDLQDADVGAQTRLRQKKEFWISMGIMYGLGFATMIYAHLIRH